VILRGVKRVLLYRSDIDDAKRALIVIVSNDIVRRFAESHVLSSDQEEYLQEREDAEKSRAELVASLVEDSCVEKGSKKETEITSCPGHFEERSKRLTSKIGFIAAQDGRILRGGAKQGL